MAVDADSLRCRLLRFRDCGEFFQSVYCRLFSEVSQHHSLGYVPKTTKLHAAVADCSLPHTGLSYFAENKYCVIPLPETPRSTRTFMQLSLKFYFSARQMLAYSAKGSILSISSQ